VFQLYKQSQRINSTDLQALFNKQRKNIPNDEINKRRQFDLLKFIERQKLGTHPSGMTFFRTVYDLSVKQIYKDKNVPEPVYEPPSFRRMDYREKRKRKELRHQWI
jgi:hypothetical protein